MGTGGVQPAAPLSAARVQAEGLTPYRRHFQQRGYISFIRKKTNPDWQCHSVSQEKRETISKCPRWAPLVHLWMRLAWGGRCEFTWKVRGDPHDSTIKTSFLQLNYACLAASQAIRAWGDKECTLFCRWEHKAQGFQRTQPGVRTEPQPEPVTPNPSPGCFLAYSIPHNHHNNWTHVYSCVADAWKQWFSNWMHIINAWWALKEYQ